MKILRTDTSEIEYRLSPKELSDAIIAYLNNNASVMPLDDYKLNSVYHYFDAGKNEYYINFRKVSKIGDI